jgi:hypothetical protein
MGILMQMTGKNMGTPLKDACHREVVSDQKNLTRSPKISNNIQIRKSPSVQIGHAGCVGHAQPRR